MPKAPIVKSSGVTPTERLLAELCERSFLRLWSYPNPYKDHGKEICDLLAVFGDHVFTFFDRPPATRRRPSPPFAPSSRNAAGHGCLLVRLVKRKR
jgi:hypothetical protein